MLMPVICRSGKGKVGAKNESETVDERLQPKKVHTKTRQNPLILKM